ncbi:hypothetical protein [Williamsia muralis]|uniref:hypothetical protein n=1 Tax=Williamsia marianensis TaxID=85044 RepID=UPI00382D2B68
MDYNQAANFFPSDVIFDTVDPYFVNPVFFNHALTLLTPTVPDSTPSWRTKRQRVHRWKWSRSNQ